jgi:hypothetical protein
MTLRIGSLVYATAQGLGVLAKSFYDAGVVTDVLVIRHGRHQTFDDWYPNATQITSLKDSGQQATMRRFCEGMDAMLFFETPFEWSLINHCRDNGVRTYLMPMFECEHARLPAQPDRFINPSLLDQQYYPQGVFIPVPVHGIPVRARTRAEVFLHNAGHGGLKGRNGTAELVEAMRHVKSGAKLVIRMQEPNRQYWAAGGLQDASEKPKNLPGNIELQVGTLPYEKLWENGGEHDVFIFPEKFNGLSLPLQEARAAGMLVMCGDRFPMNTWLPRSPLIPVAGYRKTRIGPPYNEFDEAIFDPKAIAAKIDEWHGRDITEYSESSRAWTESMSWGVLKPKYLEALSK